MRFDLIANFSPGETIPWPRTLEMIREQTALAEEAGLHDLLVHRASFRP
jgi:hypothetical protein